MTFEVEMQLPFETVNVLFAPKLVPDKGQ